MNDRHTPVVCGRGEASNVGDHSPTHADDDVGSGQAPFGERPTEVLDGGQGFGRLAIGHREDPVFYPWVDDHTNTRLGNHRGPSGGSGDRLGEPVAGARPDKYRVGPTVGQLHLDGDHGATPAPSPATCSTRAATASTSRWSVSTT